MTEPSSPATTTSHSTDITKDNFIPLFNNRIADYKEWRLRIGLYHRKMVLQNKKKEATINLLTRAAWHGGKSNMLPISWWMRRRDSIESSRCLMPASSTTRRWRCLELLRSSSTASTVDLTRLCSPTPLNIDNILERLRSSR